MTGKKFLISDTIKKKGLDYYLHSNPIPSISLIDRWRIFPSIV